MNTYNPVTAVIRPTCNCVGLDEYAYATAHPLVRGRLPLTSPSLINPPARPLDELMACYAAGTLSAPLQCLVATHLAIKPENRAFVSAMEDMCGKAMCEVPAGPVRDRDAKLAAIFDHCAAEPAAAAIKCPIVPAPLSQLLGKKVTDLQWRRRLPGIKEFELSQADGGEAKLYWINPGRVMPSHTHEGSEVTLVLRGGFSDPTGHYRRGDIAIADAELDHHPRADDDEDCICFAVIDAPLRLTGPVGRIVQRFFGH
ncbi:MAG: ChrR family anti-sigma-E factor [Alsobacter sp.]